MSTKTKYDDFMLSDLDKERNRLGLIREILILESEIKYYQGVLDGTISTEEPEGE